MYVKSLLVSALSYSDMFVVVRRQRIAQEKAEKDKQRKVSFNHCVGIFQVASCLLRLAAM